MCTRTRIKHAYQGVQGACPRQAVTSAGVTAERSERRDVGMGLKLVTCNNSMTNVTKVVCTRRVLQLLLLQYSNIV